jgi:hypothetical protein
MRLRVDTSGITFQVTKKPVDKTDQNGVQKIDRATKEPLSVTQLAAIDETGGEMLNVTTAGVPPKVTVGQQVVPVDLEAIPWATNGKNGTAFRASSIVPQGQVKSLQ